MRLAHYSDLHVTDFPLDAGWALKRAAAVASYTVLGRGRHFAGAEERIARLLADVDEQGAHHALCTGDVTGVAGADEFRRCAALFGERLADPARLTLLPGNHDRYVAGARGYEEHFARVGAADWPLLKPLPEGVTLVALDTARPTGLVDSSGRVGRAQLARAEAMLTDRSLRDRFVVVALHYGLLRATGRRDRRHHGLRDDRALTRLLDRDDVFADVVVHGHMHTAYAVRTARRQVINAGSGTDLHTACGYNLYDIDAAAHRLVCTRREWDPAAGGYRAAPASSLNFTVTTR